MFILAEWSEFLVAMTSYLGVILLVQYIYFISNKLISDYMEYSSFLNGDFLFYQMVIYNLFLILLSYLICVAIYTYISVFLVDTVYTTKLYSILLQILKISPKILLGLILGNLGYLFLKFTKLERFNFFHIKLR